MTRKKASENDYPKVHKDLFQIIKNRRSVRKFLDKPIDNKIIASILEAGFRAPFAYQACSIVYTQDSNKMKKLQGMGIYPSTKLFMVFLLDFARMEKIVQQRGYEYDFDDSLFLWIGIQDVSLVVENLVLAAEAYGLGSVLLGGAPFFAKELQEEFNVPTKAFPVVGLCLGYPDPEHVMSPRPRFPLKYSAFEDKYVQHSEEDIIACMKAMDEGYLTQGYYIKQKVKVPLKDKKDTIDFDRYSWSEHISRKITQGQRSEKTLLTILREQGFKLG